MAGMLQALGKTQVEGGLDVGAMAQAGAQAVQQNPAVQQGVQQLRERGVMNGPPN
jgi:hypothetical protein